MDSNLYPRCFGQYPFNNPQQSAEQDCDTCLSLGACVARTGSEQDRIEQDPNGLAPSASGAKLDQGKPIAGELILGFPRALTEVIRVATFGAVKYSRHGFLSVPDASTRYLDASLRHLLAYGRGEIQDPDSGCLHLAQAAWNLLAIIEIDQRAAEGLARPADASPQHEAGGNPVAGKPAAHLTECAFCDHHYPAELGFYGCPNCESVYADLGARLSKGAKRVARK